MSRPPRTSRSGDARCPHDLRLTILETLDPSRPLWAETLAEVAKPETLDPVDGWQRLFAAVRRSPEQLPAIQAAFMAYVEAAKGSRRLDPGLLLESLVVSLAAIGEWSAAEQLRRGAPKSRKGPLAAKLAQQAFATSGVSTGLALLEETSGGDSSGERHHEVMVALFDILGDGPRRLS